MIIIIIIHDNKNWMDLNGFFVLKKNIWNRFELNVIDNK